MTINMTKKESVLKTTVIGSEDGKKTFSITREFEESDGETAVMIALYPTISTEEANVFDTTSKHMIAHMPELKIRSLTMVNLFPKILGNSYKGCSMLEYDEENLQYILNLLKDNPDAKVIISWGCNMLRNTTTNRAKQFILKALSKEKPTRILQLTTDYVDAGEKEGIHALYLGLRNSSDKWRLKKYDVKTELSRIDKVLNKKPTKRIRESAKERKQGVERQI